MRKILIRDRLGLIRGAHSVVAVLPGLIVLLGALGCSRSPAEELSSKPPPASSATRLPDSSASSSSAAASSSVTGLRWDDPSRWRRRAPSGPMRVAEYLVPRAGGDATDGECTVITFGPNQGGSVSDNVDRWVRQFDPLSGAPTKATQRAGALTVTRIEAAGSYHPMVMPGAPSAPGTMPGTRLIGGIVEAPSGLWFFKLTGPDATIRSAGPEFDALLDSLRIP